MLIDRVLWSVKYLSLPVYRESARNAPRELPSWFKLTIGNNFHCRQHRAHFFRLHPLEHLIMPVHLHNNMDWTGAAGLGDSGQAYYPSPQQFHVYPGNETVDEMEEDYEENENFYGYDDTDYPPLAPNLSSTLTATVRLQEVRTELLLSDIIF